MSKDNTGYVQFKNRMLKTLYKGKLKLSEVRLLLLIARNTYGFIACPKTMQRHDRFQCSLSEMAEEIEIQLDSLKPTFRSLVNKNLITVYEAPSGRRPGTYGINPDFDSWEVGNP